MIGKVTRGGLTNAAALYDQRDLSARQERIPSMNKSKLLSLLVFVRSLQKEGREKG